MDVFLPEGFEPGLSRQRTRRTVSRSTLSVMAGGVIYPVVRRWATGFAVSAADVPALTGVVDLYDGADHAYQCLITQFEHRGDELVFTVKSARGVDYAAVFEMAADDRDAAQ